MNSLILFAQAATLAHWAVIFILVCGILGILVVVIRATGIVIPPFIITILWIVLAVVVGIAAIKFITAYL